MYFASHVMLAAKFWGSLPVLVELILWETSGAMIMLKANSELGDQCSSGDGGLSSQVQLGQKIQLHRKL